MTNLDPKACPMRDAATQVLDRPVDGSHGDVRADAAQPAMAGHPVMTGQTIQARLLWFGETPCIPGARYLLTLGPHTVAARIGALEGRVSLPTMATETVRSLSLNEVGDATLQLERPIAPDLFAQGRVMGRFALIDPETLDRVAAGIALRERRNGGLSARETNLRSFAKAVSWRAVGSMDTTMMAYIFTRHIGTSLAIGGSEVLTKTVLYYLHERVWTRVRFGRR